MKCPECAQGKTVNCTTIALDHEADEFVPCATTSQQPSAENDAQALADACEDDYQRSLRALNAAGRTCRDCAYVGYHCGDCGCCAIPPVEGDTTGGAR